MAKRDEVIALGIMVTLAVVLMLWMVPSPAFRAFMPPPQSFSVIADLTGVDPYILYALSLAFAVLIISIAASLCYLKWRTGDPRL